MLEKSTNEILNSAKLQTKMNQNHYVGTIAIPNQPTQSVGYDQLDLDQYPTQNSGRRPERRPIQRQQQQTKTCNDIVKSVSYATQLLFLTLSLGLFIYSIVFLSNYRDVFPSGLFTAMGVSALVYSIILIFSTYLNYLGTFYQVRRFSKCKNIISLSPLTI